MKKAIGILHPGEMGISVAASAKNSGQTVYWASQGRSEATRARAKEHHLHDAVTLEELCSSCPVIVSVCPPHAAEALAQKVAAQGFSGLYLDANAISPERVARIGRIMTAAGASLVDGGIIGGPAWQPGQTWLYLSGPEAEAAAACFAAGPLETRVIGGEVGKASALKMCFAAYSKGTTALLAAILAAADTLGVREALSEQWSRNESGFAEQAEARVRQVTAKAWRFVGEMEEIAATLQAAGLPGGFHEAAAETYARMAHLKDGPAPSLEVVIAALTAGRCDA